MSYFALIWSILKYFEVLILDCTFRLQVRCFPLARIYSCQTWKQNGECARWRFPLSLSIHIYRIDEWCFSFSHSIVFLVLCLFQITLSLLRNRMCYKMSVWVYHFCLTLLILLFLFRWIFPRIFTLHISFNEEKGQIVHRHRKHDISVKCFHRNGLRTIVTVRY